MANRALDLMAKISSRFAHEILPVATASVIGAVLVNHYGRQPASPSIVVQAQPSASEDAVVQSLREEHELIASFVRRRGVCEAQTGNGRRAFGRRVDAGRIGRADAALNRRDPPPRRAAARRQRQSGRAGCAKSAAARKKSAPAEAPLLQSDLPAIALETPPLLDSLPPPAQVEPESSARPIIRAAGAMREWVADVAQAPGRVAFPSRLPDWPSMPPLVRTLGFFRQN
jgi:hypothetical protein